MPRSALSAAALSSMLTRRIPNRPVRLSLALLAWMAVPAAVHAQLQWDPNMTSGAALGGTGTWTGNTTTNWYNGTANVAWDSNMAVFGGTAGTVSIDTVISPSAAGMIFNTTGYTLAAGGGTITVTGGSLGGFGPPTTPGTPTIGVLPGLSATINALIAGSGVVYIGQGNTTAYSGNVTFGGANTFTAGVNITGGATLTVSSDANFGVNPGANTANVIMNNGTLHVTSSFALGSHREIIMADGGVLFNGVEQIGGGGTITVDSGATFSVSTPFIPESTVCTIQGAGNVTITGQTEIFQPNGHLVKNGTGTLTLNNSSNSGSLTGDITVNNGILSIDQSNSLGNASTTAPEPLTLNGGELDNTRAVSATFINANRAIVIGTNGGTIKLTNATATTQTYTPSSVGGLKGPGAFTLTGVAPNAGSTLDFAGSATGAPNTNNGSTTINNATLAISGSNATNWLSANSAIILSNNGILNIAGFSQVIASLSDGAGSPGTVNLGNVGAGTLTLGGDNSSTTFSGAINGSGTNGGITKVGTGTFTLAGGSSNYGSGSGTGTTVLSGTLAVTNTTGSATGTGPVTAMGAGTGASAVGTGGTLAGTGTITPTGSNTVTIGSTTAGSQGGIVSPGLGGGAAGTLTVSSMSWNPYGRYVFAYNPTSTTTGTGVNNFITGSGTLDLSALANTSPFDLNLQPLAQYGTGAPQTYVIADFASGITGAGGVLGTPFVNGADISSLFTLSGTFRSAAAPYAMVVAGAEGGSSQAIDLTFIPPVPAGLFTWTGATSGSWSGSTNNWSPAVIPTNSNNNQITFGATPNPAMTNDIAGGLILNSMTFNAGSPVYTLAGNVLNFQTSSSGVLPSIVSNSSNSVTISAPLTLTNSLTVSGSGNVALGGAIGGAGSLTMNGSGILTLSNSGNTYSGGTNVLNGTVSVAADADLGTGNVTGAGLGTLSFTNTTNSTRSFAMNGGTILVASGKTVTFNGSQVSGATLDGGGTFATNATNGAQFIAMTATPSVAITSNSAKDQFVHFDSSAAFTVAAGVNTGGTSTTVNLNGFTNEGIGTVTIGAGSEINVANFQSYGNMTITPATGSQTTLVTNMGGSALGFNGGSQTFLGTPATAPGPTGPYLDGVDLHGHNLVLTGGLFVNNGFTVDSTGSSSIIVGYGAPYKGAGTNFVPIVTQNGGKFSAGNSPGISPNGSLVIGPGQLNTFDWQINDAGPSATHPTAPGVAGPSADTNGNVSGWSVIASEMLTSPVPPHPLSSGNLTWTASATPGNQFDFQLETLQGPTTPVGTSTDGPMADFDPTQKYVWPFLTWQGTYSGPTDTATLTADTLIDTSTFANSLGTTPGMFTIQFDGPNKSIDLVFTPVPEPGTLALVGLAAAAGWWRRRSWKTSD